MEPYFIGFITAPVTLVDEVFHPLSCMSRAYLEVTTYYEHLASTKIRHSSPNNREFAVIRDTDPPERDQTTLIVDKDVPTQLGIISTHVEVATRGHAGSPLSRHSTVDIFTV